jgi:hypothetical protein
MEKRISPAVAHSILLNAELPKRTDSYAPVSHKQVIDLTLNQISKAGLKIEHSNYTAAKDGQQGTGFYSLKGFGDKEMGLQLGWQNSYDKAMTLKWAIGGNVFICGNGMVRGDIGTFKRKHTGDVLVEYSEAVKKYVGSAELHFKQLMRDKEALKNIKISPRRQAELLGRIYFEEEILNATQLNIVKRELVAPTFNYKADGTAWQLYNHCTVALKEAHPMNLINQHNELHEFFATEYKF